MDLSISYPMKSSTRAIVIAKENFGEADQYIQFLTQDWGLITVLARAARKSKRRYVGGLDLFCHDEIFVRGDPKSKPYLNELTVLNSFPQLREDLNKLLTAGKLNLWIRQLANVAVPIPHIYSLLGQSLALVTGEPSAERLELLLLVFKIKLLSHLGLQPQLKECVKCGSSDTGRVIFDIGAGGLVCLKCHRGNPATFFDVEFTKFLIHTNPFKLKQWPELSLPSDKVNHLTHLLTQFASYHTHTRLPV